jgi:hypothetical protein
MRVSLTARFLSHPTIDFGSGRRRAPRLRLGLTRPATTYHRHAGSRPTVATVAALRSQTARFRFPSVGGAVRALHRGQALPLGPQRARRA